MRSLPFVSRSVKTHAADRWNALVNGDHWCSNFCTDDCCRKLLSLFLPTTKFSLVLGIVNRDDVITEVNMQRRRAK
jgi:hypothetical protein